MVDPNIYVTVIQGLLWIYFVTINTVGFKLVLEIDIRLD